jgi:hypothetical protein
MAAEAAPGSVDGLYQQLAYERPRRAREALADVRSVDRLFAESAAALEDAAGVLLHAATTFIGLDGPLPGMFAEQAGRCWRWRRGSRRPPICRARAIPTTGQGRGEREPPRAP